MRIRFSPAPQHGVIDALRRGATCVFIPREDRISRGSFWAGLRGWGGGALAAAPEAVASGSGLLLLAAPVIWPLYALHWTVRSGQPVPGHWLDLQAMHLLPVGAGNGLPIPLTPEMGLLAYEACVELTHPRRGPLLTLINAPSTQSQDRLALNDLARECAERTGLRLVGARAH